ncbi:MAG: M66 family metalloprotease [Pseudomonadota bacterium]
MSSLELAQTHVLPEEGKSWILSNATEALHFVGQRKALALVQIAQANASNPVLEGWRNGSQLGTVALAAPNLLARTEGSGPAYASDRYSATIPAVWMKPGLQLRISASNFEASAFRKPIVGADMPVILRVLPFYLFGANDSTKPFDQVKMPDATTIGEVFEKWPVAQLDVANHAAQRISWPTLVIGPRNDASGIAQPAYVARNSSEQKGSFAVLSAALGLLGDLLVANGEASQNVQYYSPLILIDQAGRYASPGGGLGSSGGDTGAGDINYAGIFIHEQGHAMGLPHAGEAFDQGRYPYEWGSLKGSAWGFDFNHQEFLPPFMATTSADFSSCASDSFAGHARAADGSSRCIKQDPMQSGAGDQDPGYKFATFSDYSSAVMQRHFEGLTTTDSSGGRVYDGGYIVEDSSFPGGYKRWDRIDLQWVNHTPTTTNYAQYGYLQGFPVQKNVPVHAIALTISKAGSVGATQIYPPLNYTGNLIQYVDPTDTAQRADIVHYRSPYNGSGKGRWYCSNSGCDYTVRVTYANGTVRHVGLQGAFRNFDRPGGIEQGAASDFEAGTSDPKDGDSFRHYVIHVLNDAPLAKIELLDTPTYWRGLPANPTVLASR